MKILLTTLNAKYVHSAPALRYLYNSAGGYGKFIHIHEFTINHNDGHIFTEILRNDYDVVCFSCYIWNGERILYLAENLKKAAPQMKIILGGPEATQRWDDILERQEAIDFVVLGEGEKVFPMLLNALLQKQDWTDIPGLAGRVKDGIFYNQPDEAMDFSQVPFIYDKIPWEDDRIIYYEASRGCAFRCGYCLSSIDKTVRQRPIHMVKKELDHFLRGKVRQVKLVDRTFNLDPQRCYDLFKYLMDNDNGVTNFHFELCGELITAQHIELLKRARQGLFRFEIGVQSTNEETLKACNRPGNFDRIKENVKALRVVGNIVLHLDLIAGLPYEDYNTFRKSFNDVYSLLPDELQLGFLKMLPGTALRKEAEKYGYVYRRKAPYEMISNDFLSIEDVIKLKDIEHVLDLYYNKGGFKSTLEYLTGIKGTTPFDFYSEFADYYYGEGLQHRSHSKESLYRIMYGYGLRKSIEYPELWVLVKELLREDMAKYLNPETVKRFDKIGWES
ncbi:MAG: DUF4080 domain-containing protein [Anaerovoracaceae bacterium]|jgi:radical SAM superfamily enzyme YgiQ (UPF0313 family)